MKKLRQLTPEVYFRPPEYDAIGPDCIAFLKQQARNNASGKCRLCLHMAETDPVHEMLIVHTDQVHVPPHIHEDKAETLLVLEGRARLFFFHADGQIERAVPLGGATGNLLCVVPAGACHSLLIESPCLVFHETTTGPFVAGSMRIPDWAPRPEEADSVACFRNRLVQYKQPPDRKGTP